MRRKKKIAKKYQEKLIDAMNLVGTQTFDKQAEPTLDTLLRALQLHLKTTKFILLYETLEPSGKAVLGTVTDGRPYRSHADFIGMLEVAKVRLRLGYLEGDARARSNKKKPE